MSTDRTLPPIGTRLLAYRRKPNRHVVHGVVVQDESFPSKRALDVDGRRFSSLSGAASEITGRRRNGWLWWRSEDGRPIGEQEPTT